MAAEAGFIEVIIGVGILLAAAIIVGELFSRIKLPVVLGQLIAGMIIGPFALGAFLLHPDTGESILQIGPEIRTLGEIGAIVILFMAGLEMTPKEFLRGGKASFTVGALGVVVPFIAGFIVFQNFGFDALQAMMIATALTATSIAISIQVLKEFNKIKSPEARLIIAAAVVDDILAIAVLSVVTSFGGAEALDTVDLVDVTFTILKVLGFFAAILIAAIFVIPKVMTTRLWKSTGSIEGIATASFFGAAAIAGSLGLSPILCSELFSAISEIREANTGILLVEQNAKRSLEIADRCYLIETGRIATEDTVEGLKGNQTILRSYLGGEVRFAHRYSERLTTKTILSEEISELTSKANKKQKDYVDSLRTNFTRPDLQDGEKTDG